jgi:hypothetical protein
MQKKEFAGDSPLGAVVGIGLAEEAEAGPLRSRCELPFCCRRDATKEPGL